MKDGVSTDEVAESILDTTMRAEALNREPDDIELTETVVQVLDKQGIRITEDEDSAEEHSTTEKAKHTKKFGKDTNIREARALSQYVTTKGCRRDIWNEFFENNKKCMFISLLLMSCLITQIPQLEYGVNTSFKQIEGMWCCDHCTPRLFPIEKVTVKAVVSGLRRGKKKAIPPEQEEYIINKLKHWRDETLVDAYYGHLTSLSGATIMGDDIVKKLASCGEWLENYSQVQRYVRWVVGYDEPSHTPTVWGQMLMTKLGDIYNNLDGLEEEQERARYKSNTEMDFVIMTAADFE
jgi:hypothetical protein